MNNEPVAWMYACNGIWTAFSDELPPDDAYDEGTLTPLYTHPAPTKVKFASNSCESGWIYLDYEEPAKTLTDEEIKDIGYKFNEMGLNLEMIRAILRKAQEK